MIALSDAMMAIPHPNSETGMNQFDIAQDQRHLGHAGVFIKIVDNERLHNVRFFYAAKQVIEVPCIKDTNLSSGVYCTIRSSAPHGGLLEETKVFTYEEAEVELGLYRTREEAESCGNPQILLAIEEQKTKRELSQLKIDNEKLKLENVRLTENFNQRVS